MSMEDLWLRQSVHGWVLFLGIKSVYSDKSERNSRGKCLGWPVTSYGGGFKALNVSTFLESLGLELFFPNEGIPARTGVLFVIYGDAARKNDEKRAFKKHTQSRVVRKTRYLIYDQHWWKTIPFTREYSPPLSPTRYTRKTSEMDRYLWCRRSTQMITNQRPSTQSTIKVVKR